MNEPVALEILYAHSGQLYSALLSVMSPVIGGVDYFKKMHREYRIRKEIQSLQRKQEAFVLAVTGALQGTIEEYDKAGENLKKIQDNPQFVADFEKLNTLFNSLDAQDQINIIVETAKMTQQVFTAMRDDIAKKGVGSSDPEHMLVLSQALRCGIIMLDTLIASMKKRPPDMRQTEFCVDFLLVLLTKFLAISIGKMDIDRLYDDIAFCIYHTKPQVDYPVDKAVFSILGEDE
jgi:hypothetical protein